MYHFIVNPASRSGYGGKLWKETIEPILKQRKIKFDARFSRKPGDLTRLAADVTQNTDAEDPKHIVIVGGDGTVNETLQGITDFSKVIISYIPTGSSNDLARNMGFPKESTEVLNHLLDRPETVILDAGVLTTPTHKRTFEVSCGIGFDAAVCHEAMKSRIKDTFNRIGLGKLTYVGIALRQLIATKSVSCDIYLDDQEPIHIKKLLFVSVMNHRYEGGGFKFCPAAVPDDGLLDLCVVGDIPKLKVLFALPTAFPGKHLKFRGINSYRASSVKIQTSDALWIQADGEVWERGNALSVSCLPKHVTFRY